MSYNKGGQGVREGNWVEEASLCALTGSTRYKLPVSTTKGGRKPLSDTAIRVIAHSDAEASKDWNSTNKSTLSDPAYSKTYRRANSTGSRAKLWEKKYYAEVMAEMKQEGARESKRKEQGRFETTSQATHRNPGKFGEIGKRVMKNQDGGLPVGRNEAFYEAGLHARPAKLSKERLAGESNNNSYLNDTPISIYTQRLVEGTFPASRVTHPARLFSRNTGFTNEIMDGTKMHFNAVDGPSGVTSGALNKKLLVEAAGGSLAVADVLSRVLESMEMACGGRSVRAMSRLFQRMDKSGDKRLSRAELKAGLESCRVRLRASDLDVIFAHFDRDKSGFILAEEFLRGCRGRPSARRIALMKQAFGMLDKTGDGQGVAVDDLKAAYDCSKHPRLQSGEMSKAAVMGDFVRQWSNTRTAGVVTFEEFVDYYTDVGASIPDEEGFELLMRNAWHISGATGTAERTPCRRVLVTLRDGRQSVEEIKAVLRSTDFDKMLVQLHRQGVHNVVQIELTDGSKKSFPFPGL